MINKRIFLSLFSPLILLLFTFLFFNICLDGKIKLGIDVLEEEKFSIIKNKNVALLTNTSAQDSKGKFVLDIFAENKNFQLKVVLLPEHNGNFDDKKLEELKKKGISVHCTHTPTGRSPLPEWFKEVDVVVADMYDIGIRYYTHFSSVLYTMIKAFEMGKRVIILDRTNPLGRNFLGGPTMDKKYPCFLGSISREPLFHGMTMGEKANYVKNRGEDFKIECNCTVPGCDHGISCDAKTLKKGELIIVKVKDWNRKKTLLEREGPDLRIPMSPAIQNAGSIFEYVITSLSILAGLSYIDFIRFVENVNFPDHKFKYFYSPHFPAIELLDKINNEYHFALNGCKLTATKIDTSDMQKVDCLELSVTDFSSSEPAGLSLALLAEAQRWVPERDWETFEKTIETNQTTATSTPNKTPSTPIRNLEKLTLNQQKDLRKAKWDRLTKLQRELIQKHIGDDEFVSNLFDGELIDVMHFRNKWKREATSFYNETKKYYLY